MSTTPRTINDEKTLQTDFELQTLTAGMTLCGKYRLEREAGKGGMGVVWKAWDSIGGRWVALKFVPPEIRHQESAMARIRNVFQTIQALNHPNICPIYGLENAPIYGFFVVKKWLEGQSLSETRLARDQVVPVLEKVADALDYAHSEGVLHRDVKPSNIFLGTDGKVTLIDFGIAANLHSETQATQGQFSTSGTDKYMAPEQRFGQLQTAQTDEYSLALVALELLAGTLSPLAYRRISPEIQNVLDVALSDEPSKRFATCREFVDSLTISKSPDPFASFFAKEEVYCEKLPELALAAYQAGKHTEAAKYLQEYLKYHPENKNAERLLARCEATFVISSTDEVLKKVEVCKSHLRPPLIAGNRKVLKSSWIEYAFRWCPPGEFTMGSSDERSNEKPPHTVRITRGFWLLETPVTQEMWESVMQKNPSWFQKGLLVRENDFQRPVEQITWKDCQDFCMNLSRKLGETVQLPTEAQWEYACRAGTTGDYAGTVDEMAWYFSNSDGKTHAVGLKKPNAWGLYDMHGNVWEFCSDWYGTYDASPVNDPKGPRKGWIHVIRGGCWFSAASGCRSAFRNYSGLQYRSSDLGLRVLLLPGPND